MSGKGVSEEGVSGVDARTFSTDCRSLRSAKAMAEAMRRARIEPAASSDASMALLTGVNSKAKGKSRLQIAVSYTSHEYGSSSIIEKYAP